MPKQTKLGEDAALYQPRQERTEKEKLRNMTMGKRVSYLWEYYKLHALVGIIAIAFVSYVIYHYATPKVEPQFYAAIVNNSIPTEVLDQYSVDFEKMLELNPETEKVMLNYNFYFNGDGEYAMNMRQALSMYVAAQEVDVIIAPESEFKDFAYYGFMTKLSDALPTDIYSSLTDYFYLSAQEDNPEQQVLGIYLTETELFKNNAVNTDPYILGVIANYPHKDNTIDFIRFLFGK